MPPRDAFFRFPSSFIEASSARLRSGPQFLIAMADPSPDELKATVEELSAYRDRLKEDVIAMGQKLKLPQKRIELTLSDHPELQRLEAVLAQLDEQIRNGSEA